MESAHCSTPVNNSVYSDGIIGLLNQHDRTSLLKIYLTPEVLEKVKDIRTAAGATLCDIIRSGLAESDSVIGVFLPDAASLEAFQIFLGPLLTALHSQLPAATPSPYMSCPGEVRDERLDPRVTSRILSTRARVARNLHGFPFPSAISSKDRQQVDHLVSHTFTNLCSGTYRPLASIPVAEKENLIAKGVLFKDNDKYLRPAGFYKDWPVARGLYHDPSDGVIVWVNEEDHLRIITMSDDANIYGVYSSLHKFCKKLEEHLTFAHDRKWGWLTSCPSNLGTGLRVSVHIRLNFITQRRDFNDICKSLNLEVRGRGGENTDLEGDVLDVSNRRRTGVSELQAIVDLIHGLNALVGLDEQKREGLFGGQTDN